METSNLANEYAQINKIVQVYNKNLIKKSFLLANLSKSEFPKLVNIPIFHNIYGLINFRLKDWEQSINNFETAIKLNPKFVEAYYNIGLAYFETGNLEKSYNYLFKAINIKKDYIRARNKIIELLSFYKPKNVSENYLINLHQKIKETSYNIDFSKKIVDEHVTDYINRCKKLVTNELEDLSYNKYQIFRRKSLFLNCERHKGIFFKYKTIPNYCFSCFKVVIISKNLIDLIKVAFVFDQVSYFFNFNRKSIVDKRYGDTSYKSLIYCTSIDQVYEVEKNTKDILTKIVDQDIVIESKRGCSEFALSYPNYKKIYKDRSKLMNYPNEWIVNEKEFDEENSKDNIESKRIIQDTLSGGSLNNFLIINNWLND